MVLHLKTLRVNLPWGIGGVVIDVTQAQANAAWALYVEFSTRVASQPLEPGAGSISEALDSLYGLFATTRQVLREAGPDAAHGPDSVGPIIIRVLNEGLRPFLVKWHSAYLQALKAGGESWNEDTWEENNDFYDALGVLRNQLNQLMDSLAELAGVKK